MVATAEPTTIFLIFLVFVIFMIVKGLANPRSRPFLVLGLLAIGLAAFVLLGYVGVRHTGMTEFDRVRIVEENQRASANYSPPAPPGYSSMHSTELVRPRKAKTSAAPAKVAKLNKSDASNKLDTSAKPATPPKDESDDAAPQPPQPPAWVKAEPKMQGSVYLMTRQTDPYSTTLECEREVPKALQSAVSEYAQLLLGNDQAKYVRFSESDLLELVREKWDEPRTIDIGGESKAMHTLHVLIGFDQAMKLQIRSMAENAIVTQRLKGAGVVLGGFLGLLALVWGGLSLMGNRQDAKAIQATAAPAAVKARAWPVVTVVSVACLFAAVIVLATLAFYLG
jgi:hypothetical protein